MKLSELKKYSKQDNSKLKKVKAALLADNPSQLLATALKGYGVLEDYNLDLYEAEYNQIEFQVFNTESELYSFCPDFLVIHQSSEKLIQKFYASNKKDKHLFSDHFLNSVEELISTINGQIQTKIVFFNFPEINDAVFGNYANSTDHSSLFHLRKINLGLMNLAQKHKNFFINDVAVLQAQIGREYVFSPSMYANSSMVFTVDFLPDLAKNIWQIIKANQGQIKKCLVLDLDNTLWGGIIGDDGMEGIEIGHLGIGEVFSEFQTWIKELKDRGIVLAVCSKNEEKAAMEPFLSHPDMVLHASDIAVFMANWDNKADNIRHIQSILNIGFDSMVFLDDNPVERKMVRDNLPDVCVPELPQDPAEYLTYLQRLYLFETASFSSLDGQRTQQYQEEAKRAKEKKSFVNEEDFLRSLNMMASVSSFSNLDLPRIAQLTQRSNQFNLRTIRYSEEELKSRIENPMFHTVSVKLQDAYGDYGLISVIILELVGNDSLFIDTWLMSCRVLKRNVENLVLNEIVQIAQKENRSRIIGEWIPTAKNVMVKDHFQKLGFTLLNDGKWELMVDDFQFRKHNIDIIS